VRRDVPEQEALVARLAVVEAADGPGIGDALPPDAATGLPALMAVDVAQQHRLRTRVEQAAGRELVVEAGHRHTVLGEAVEHGAVGHQQGRQPERSRLRMHRRQTAQQRRNVFAGRTRRVRGTRCRGHGRAVDRGQARDERPQPLGQALETPARRCDPAARRAQTDLPDAVGHVHGVASTQLPEHRQGTRRFMRPGALQHQYRTVVREAPHPVDQRHRGGRMQVQRMVGAVAGDHRRLCPQNQGALDGGGEAAVGLVQVARPVVQVGEVRHPQRALSLHDTPRRMAATLSA